MPICTRRSCGQEQSSTSPCVFHPGSPVFHEGQKSWSCCKEINKPVLEFDEFMKIKGCQTLDSHSSEKLPVEIPKAKDDGGIMKGMSIDKDGKEIYGNQSQSNPNPTSSVNITQPMTNMNLNSSSNPSSKNGSANAGGGSKEEKKPKELEQDPKDVDPTEGTVCKRSGCGKAFQGGKRVREEESCTFHRGSAIFHEGSKGWTCCKRRVLDFNDFLTIEPCTTSDRGHLFIGAPKEPSFAGGEEEVQCRLDHYETPADVRLTVYAKGVDMEKSKIEFKEDEVIFSLSLPPLASNPSTARRFNKILLPFAPIDAEASTFSLTKFKVDCILIKKQKGQSWPVLERTDGVTGYGLTFGRE